MDSDTFNSYINEAFVDASNIQAQNSGASDYDQSTADTAANSMTNDLLLQLLLGATGSTGTSGVDATIDPNSLTSATQQAPVSSAQNDTYMGLASPISPDMPSVNNPSDTDASMDPNNILAAALFSALANTSAAAVAAAEAANSTEQDAEPMAVDAPLAEPFDTNQDTVVPADTAKPGQLKSTSGASRSSAEKKQQQQQQHRRSSTATPTEKRSAGSKQDTAAKSSKPQASAKSSVRRSTSPSETTNAAADSSELLMADEHKHEADELDGVDLKNMTPKERRQLRNKISARNFRVRRKEYIANLESEVRMHKEEADSLRKELNMFKSENSQLRDELQKLRSKFNSLSLKSPTPVSAVVAGLSSPGVGRNGAALGGASQPSSPVVRFNPHKDIGHAAAKNGAAAAAASPSAGNWATKGGNGGFITVNTALMPPDMAARAEEIVSETRRALAINALLEMWDEETAERASAAEMQALAAVVA